MEQPVVLVGNYSATFPLPNKQDIELAEPLDEFLVIELDAEELQRFEPFE